MDAKKIIILVILLLGITLEINVNVILTFNLEISFKEVFFVYVGMQYVSKRQLKLITR